MTTAMDPDHEEGRARLEALPWSAISADFDLAACYVEALPYRLYQVKPHENEHDREWYV
jgi:hypothetical protein